MRYFDIVVQGVGCQGAMPHLGIDAIVVASSIVMNVSHVMSREIDPTHPPELTFGKLHSGEAGNVIADQTVLADTLRTTTIRPTCRRP